MFSSKNVTNWAKHVLLLRSWEEKKVYEVETHWLSYKENIPGAAVNKGHADSLLGQKKTYHYRFPWKKSATVNNAYGCQFLRQKFPFFYWLSFIDETQNTLTVSSAEE